MKNLTVLSVLLAVSVWWPVQADQQQSAEGCENHAEVQQCIEAMKSRVAKLEGELKNARKSLAGLEGRLQAGQSSLVKESKAIAGAGPPNSTPVTSRWTDSGPAAQTDSGLAITRTSLTWERLQFGGVQDVSRLDRLIPGLQYGRSGHDVRLSMRGARNNSVGPQAEQVVGIHVDGVYVPSTMQALEPYLDVERIDVLRGPQGLAYRRNTIGGAIHIKTYDPNLDRFEGRIEGVMGRFDRARFEAVFNIPFNDQFAFRFAALADAHSGIIINPHEEPDSDDLNSAKTQMVSAAFRWRPSNRFDTILKVKFLDKNGNGTGIWGYQQTVAYVDGELLPGHQFAAPGVIQDLGPYIVWRNFLATDDMENLSSTLSVNWDMGFAQMQWISNFTELEATQLFDSDYSDAGEARSSDFAGWNTFQDSWSSEIRLSSATDNALDWVLGLYTFDRSADWSWLEANTGLHSPASWDNSGKYSIDSQAAYGRLAYGFSDRWRMSGELRWFKDTKQLRTGETDSWSDVIWKAATEFDLSPRVVSYLSASTGARSGGLNNTPGAPAAYDPESVTALEVGFRSQFSGGKLRLNVAAFYNDYKDMQAQSFGVGPMPGSQGALEYIGNGGSMTAKGAEIEFQWLPGENWDIGLQLAYLDARFGTYDVAGIAGLGDIEGHTEGDRLSLNGWRPAFSPKITLGLQAGYLFRTKRWGTLKPYIQTYYSSEYSASDINLPGTMQSSHTTTDVRLTWLAPGGRFRFEGYALNVEDEALLSHVMVYNPSARPDIATIQTNWRKPRLIGVIFSYDF